jgi:3-oxoadipate enol-lactonase/4-carboxymuconolactone decarboxylase
LPSIHTNGIDQHYLQRGEEGGPTAVLMHAATVQGAALAWATRAMARWGFHVYAPDVRGHGETHNPAPDIHMPRLVADHIGFLEGVGQRGGLPVHGFGYSMGGGITMYAALERPEWFRSLVLMGTNYRPAPWETIQRVVGPVAQRKPMEAMVFDKETGIHIGWGRDVDTFKRLKLPTLIIIGDRDEFIPVGDVLPLVNALPHAELLVVPNTGHLGLVNHPMVLEAMADFYARVEPHADPSR